MNKTISLVQRVQIASPCTASWDEMTGDDKSRFCSHCKLNVYNLSAMTQEEGERLIIEKEGKLCARIYRRSDGTVLTKDCPIGLRAIRKRLMWAGVRTASVLIALASTMAAMVGLDQMERRRRLDHTYTPVASTFRHSVRNMERWLNSGQLVHMQTIELGRHALQANLASELDKLLEEQDATKLSEFRIELDRKSDAMKEAIKNATNH